MRVVIDTNVLVSGLMKKERTPPGRVVDDLQSGDLVVLYDQRILSEYRDVLVRPKLTRIHLSDAMVLLGLIDTDGEEVEGASCARRLLDPTDQPFADVAFTGNIRDFLPVGDLIRVVTPRQWLDLKASLQGE